MRYAMRISIVLAGILASAAVASADIYTWVGATSNATTNAANWSITASTEAYRAFGPVADGAFTTLSVGSNISVSPALRFVYVEGQVTPSYTLSGSRFESGSVTVEAGVATDQTVNSSLKTSGGVNISHNGTGVLKVNDIYNSGGFQTSTYNAAFNVAEASAKTVLGNLTTSGRVYTFTKTGAGTLAITGTLDIKVGGYDNNGTIGYTTFVSTFTVNGGTLDVSSMNANFETWNTADYKVTEDTYVLINYANGALIKAGTGDNVFETFANIPAGYHIEDDTVNKRIVLTTVPEPTTLGLLGLGLTAALRRRLARR